MNLFDTFTQYLAPYWMILLILFLVFVVGLSLYFYLAKRSEDYYKIGYKKGKKIVKSFGSELKKDSKGLGKGGTLEDGVRVIQDRVFKLAHSHEVGEYQQEIVALEARINDVKAAAVSQPQTTEEEYQARERSISEEIEKYEHDIAEEEEALYKLQREEDVREQQLSEQIERKGQQNSFFERAASATQNVLVATFARVEKDLMLYGYLAIALLLFAGDYAITYFIFNDILKVIEGSVISLSSIGIEMAYIASGVATLVFVVLVDFLLEFLDKNHKKYINAMRVLPLYAILTIGTLMLAAYVLIILIPILQGFESRIIDVLLRILFVPLVFAVSLMFHKIRKVGGFNFLFTPFKIILLPILLIVLYLALGLEIAVRYTNKHLSTSIKATRKKTLQEISKIKAVSNLQGKLDEKRSVLSSLASDFDNRNQLLQRSIGSRTSPLEQKRDEYVARVRLLRRGCDDAVIGNLRL